MSITQSAPVMHETVLNLSSPKEQDLLFTVVDEAKNPSLRSSILTLLQLFSPDEPYIHVDETLSRVAQQSGVTFAAFLWAEAAYWKLLSKKVLVRDGGDFLSLRSTHRSFSAAQ